MKVDLRKQTAKQALALAKSVSGLTIDEIAERSGIPEQTIAQYFKASGEAYFPSLPKIPVLCRALDNTILLDWLHAQLEEADPHQEVRSCTTLLKRVTKLGGDFGGLCNSVDAAIKDNILTGDEAQHICGALYEVEAHARGLRDGLVKISGQKFVPGKGFVRMEMEETPDGSLKSVREVAHQ